MSSRKYDMRGRWVRHRRVRKKVRGAPERPRLSVFRSNKHIYAQVIDDQAGRTLASARSAEVEGASKSEVAAAVGSTVAKRAQQAGVKAVVFDRGGYRYHGRVKALADAARAEGLDF